MAPNRGLRTFTIVFGAASLVAVASGAFVAASSGVPAVSWGLNVTAWAVGLAAGAVVARTAGSRAAWAFVAAAMLGVALTFADAGLEGVHRWVELGPVRLNAAALLLPAAVIGLAAGDLRRAWPWVGGAALLALLIAQPDASQVTAVAAALVAAIMVSPLPLTVRLAAAAAGIVGALAAWLRPDPLTPVPEVEEIFRLAGEVSPPVMVIAAVALAAASAAPLLLARSTPAARPSAVALAVYFIVSSVSPLLGAFPTPLVGMGVSPVIGFWLGAGILVALARRPEAASAP